MAAFKFLNIYQKKNPQEIKIKSNRNEDVPSALSWSRPPDICIRKVRIPWVGFPTPHNLEAIYFQNKYIMCVKGCTPLQLLSVLPSRSLRDCRSWQKFGLRWRQAALQLRDEPTSANAYRKGSKQFKTSPFSCPGLLQLYTHICCIILA